MSLNAKSLWLAKDHLLYVQSIMFNERYKRFYFNDIQCILLQRTRAHWIWSFIWGGFTLLFGIVLLSLPGFPIPSVLCFAGFLLALLVNLVMGPACTVHLQTAVQLQKIACLKRVRSAEKVLTLIKSLIEEAQGAWRKQESVNEQNAVLSNEKKEGGPPGKVQ